MDMNRLAHLKSNNKDCEPRKQEADVSASVRGAETLLLPLQKRRLYLFSDQNKSLHPFPSR